MHFCFENVLYNPMFKTRDLLLQQARSRYFIEISSTHIHLFFHELFHCPRLENTFHLSFTVLRTIDHFKYFFFWSVDSNIPTLNVVLLYLNIFWFLYKTEHFLWYYILIFSRNRQKIYVFPVHSACTVGIAFAFFSSSY